MPRYFFDLKRSGNDFDPDPYGVIFKNIKAAEKEALVTLGEMLRDQMGRGVLGDIVLRVRTETGEVVLQARVSVHIMSIQPD